MSRPMRGLIVTVAAMCVVGFVLPVSVATVMWFLSVPRRWWSLSILLVMFLIPAATGIVGTPRVRRLRQEIEAERVSRSRAEHTA